MRFREVAILDDETQTSDSGTKSININLTDPITELILRVDVTNTAVLHNTPAETIIDKIELVDGGRTYWDLIGEEAVAAACFDLGKYPNAWYDESAGVGQSISIPITFGRYLGDPLFAFNPAALLNPQLRITYAKASGHTTGTVKLGLTARVMEGIGAPSQALMWHRVEAFLSAASGVHRVEMPVDYPYRRMAIRSYYQGLQQYNTLTHYKMSCDEGSFIPIDLAQWELYDIVKQMFGPFEFTSLIRFDETALRDMWMEGNAVMLVGGAETPGINISGYSSNYSWFWSRAYNEAGTGQSDAKGICQITGYFPHSTICYQFGQHDDPATWFNIADFKAIDLDLTQGEVSCAVSVLVQQPRSMP